MKKLFLTLVLVFAYGFSSYAYYGKNYPITVTQPDGTIVECFATGDEFYNWVHDENGFTLIRDPQTGVVVYATLENDELVSTGYRVGSVDPASVGLTPWMNISAEQRMQRRDDFLNSFPEKPVREGYQKPRGGWNNGTLNNLVIYIRFADEAEFPPNAARYDNFFNRDEPEYPSMYTYYKTLTKEKTLIPSTFYPVSSGDVIISYQDTYPRKYFQPYNATTNPDGYPNDNQARIREQQMLQRAVDAIKHEIPESLDIDFNNDGLVDNVCFLVSGQTDGWSDLLWPHRSWLASVNVNINGKRVYDYVFLIEKNFDSEGASVASHEMFHALGAPDLYRYYNQNIDPVGKWDLMCENTNPPQSTTAFMQMKYGGWIDNIPEITETGSYSLHNVWSETNNAYRIASPNSTTEYFVIEYRDKNVYWDSKIPGSGLIIYRINTKASGNDSGPPDELYIFRQNGTSNTTPGSISSAYFESSGRTVFNDYSNPPCFLSDNTPGGIAIYGMGPSGGETMSFYVDFEPVNSELIVSPASLTFANVPVGTTSAPQSTTVFSIDLKFPVLYEIVGTNPEAFIVEETDWNPDFGGELSVKFAPDATKIYSANLRITSAGAMPQMVTLKGQGSVAIEEQDVADGITIYPNPTTGELRITGYRHCGLDPQSPENDEIAGQARNDIQSVGIFDVMGRMVMPVETLRATSLQSEIGQSEIEINISHLPSGMYFIRIQTENGVVTKKMVKR